MRILHSSDLHGGKSYKRLLEDHANTDFDVWVDTGDFLDTKGRGPKTNGTIDPGAEHSHQLRWLGYKSLVSRIKEWLHGRPAVMVQGNHDFVSLPHQLQAAGVNVHIITPAGFTLLGKRWTGFREVNWMSGEWVGEQHGLEEIVEQTMASNPDILVTHAPPAGILDGYNGYGIRPLTTALTYSEHNVKAHLFGHAHESAGMIEEMGVTFYNGAGSVKVIDLSW